MRQHDPLWAANVAYEAAKADPSTAPAEVERLRHLWEILAKHWPYSRTVEEAERAEAKLKVKN